MLAVYGPHGAGRRNQLLAIGWRVVPHRFGGVSMLISLTGVAAWPGMREEHWVGR